MPNYKLVSRILKMNINSRHALLREDWIYTYVLGTITFLVFANTLANSFVFDDEHFIVRNQFLRSWKFLPELLSQNIIYGSGMVSNLYRPLQSLTHFIDMQIWQGNAWGHHLTSVLLHVGLSMSVFRLLLKIFPVVPTFIACLIFSLHPLHAESVAYLSGRGDTLGLLFLFLGILFFDRNILISIVFSILSILSKENFAFFPLFLILFTMLKRGNRWFERPLRFIPFIIVSLLYMIARLTVLNFRNTLNFYDGSNLITDNFLYRFYTYLTTLPKGVMLWFLPYDLHHERSWDFHTSFSSPQVYLSFAFFILLLTVLVWAIRKKMKPIYVGLVWFFVATIPTSNLFVVINALFYDHWFILPGFGLIIILAQITTSLWRYKYKKVILVPICCLLLILIIITFKLNMVWKNPLTLNEYLLKYETGSAKIYNNLAMEYSGLGKIDKSIEYFKKAISLNYSYPQIHHNLAHAYFIKGEVNAAILELKKALKINPRFYHSWMRLSYIYYQQKDYPKAIFALNKVISIYPYSLNSYLNLAMIYRLQNKNEMALQVLRKGLLHLKNNQKILQTLKKYTKNVPK